MKTKLSKELKNSLEKLGGKKIKIFLYLLENADKENIFLGSYKKISQETEVSIPTILTVMKYLQNENVIEKIQNGAYKIILK